MMNRICVAGLLTCLIFTCSISTSDAFAQRKARSKPSSRTVAVSQNGTSESTKQSKRAAIDVTGLQTIGAPHSTAMLGDTVVSRDGQVKVINTPTGSYFIVNKPSAAQRDTLNDWFGSSQRGDRASEQKRR